LACPPVLDQLRRIARSKHLKSALEEHRLRRSGDSGSRVKMWVFVVIVRRVFASFRRACGPAIRSLALVLVSFNVTFGFISGLQAETAGYDPHIFATGLSGLFAAACGALAFLVYVNHQLRGQIRLLEVSASRH
jgi:hypothetical protein